MTAATDSPSETRWKARFHAARMTLPEWALQHPDHCVFVSNASGTFEIYTWDRTTGATHQVTDRATGTTLGTIDPTGEWIWWFDDRDGDEFGVWRKIPFDYHLTSGGSAPEAVPGLAPSYPSGLSLGPDGLAIIGRSTDDGAAIYATLPDADARLLYSHAQHASVIALSRDAALVAIEHSEHGDTRHPALRVLKVADGAAVADLYDGPGRGLEGVAFAPVAGDSRLICRHERLGRWMPFIWDVNSGAEQTLAFDLPGDVSAHWFADASALLVLQEYEARSSLYRYDLATESLHPIEIPAGTIAGATARPDGVVEFIWSSGAEPPAVRDSQGHVVIRPPGEVAPESVAVSDAWVEGPGGPIHALVSKPIDTVVLDGAPAVPLPTVFIVHGGPTAHDTDAFFPGVAAWVDSGFVVIRVNYRGSTGYGSAWRDAIEHRVGLTELEDLLAVRDWAVESGLSDPSRIVLAGGSWGGYLTLLGVGLTPDAWSVGVAGVPVADYVAAYEDEMEGLRAFDRSLFGGTPEEVPDRYTQSSPITYVDDVKAPVFISAGANDPRCPIRQIENYLDRLRDRGADFSVYRFDAGHGSLVVDERIRQTEAQLNFALTHLGMD
ncbi:MAG TPA: prolyl oligopeptidase family serine peptidase [Acidothermaceae bacterium]|jgi:dipeptidyl aminopeptidase/acylaminoacyl peptidase